jgi:hypothetical protein
MKCGNATGVVDRMDRAVPQRSGVGEVQINLKPIWRMTMKTLKVLAIAGVISLQGMSAAFAGEIKGDQKIKADANVQVQTNTNNSEQKMNIGGVSGKGVISGKQNISTKGNVQVQTNTNNSKQGMEVGTVQ